MLFLFPHPVTNGTIVGPMDIKKIEKERGARFPGGGIWSQGGWNAGGPCRRVFGTIHYCTRTSVRNPGLHHARESGKVLTAASRGPRTIVCISLTLDVADIAVSALRGQFAIELQAAWLSHQNGSCNDERLIRLKIKGKLMENGDMRH